jgi:hypothetical protein
MRWHSDNLHAHTDDTKKADGMEALLLAEEEELAHQRSSKKSKKRRGKVNARNHLPRKYHQ